MLRSSPASPVAPYFTATEYMRFHQSRDACSPVSGPVNLLGNVCVNSGGSRGCDLGTRGTRLRGATGPRSRIRLPSPEVGLVSLAGSFGLSPLVGSFGFSPLP